MRYSKAILLIILLILTGSIYSRSIIRINSQESFDNLIKELVDEINSGETNIKVVFTRGTYVAKEKHITLNGINAPNTKIRFVGDGSIFVPEGKVYDNADPYRGYFSPFTSWMDRENDADIWSDIKYADGLIEMVDETTQLYRLKSKETLPNYLGDNYSYILIPHGYISSIYQIERIENDFIYFKANDVRPSYTSLERGINLNDDFNYVHGNVRFKVSNLLEENIIIKNGRIYFPRDLSSVREGFVYHYFYIKDCYFRSLEISNIKILGNQGDSFVSSRAAIYLNNVHTDSITIKKCEFKGMRCNAVSVISTPNTVLIDNHFSDCYYHGIEIDNKSNDAIVKRNCFVNMGKRMLNSFCVKCWGKNYLIADNLFVDYGYSGIGVGIWYKDHQDNPCYGLIKDNRLEYSNDYFTNIGSFGLLDGGAIYLWTKNDGTIIRNNIIQNYTGIGMNHGIYCDDGAYGFSIYGNAIFGIPHGYCIDSRRVSKVEEEKTPGTGIERSNVNINIHDNYLDGNIRFEGNEKSNNGCNIDNNVFFVSSLESPRESLLRNTISTWENTTIYFHLDDGNMVVSGNDYKTLKRSKSWELIKKYIVQSRQNN